MYFSVISPAESQLRQAAHELAQSPYAEHQWLWQFFPSASDQQRDFIFCRHEQGSLPRFYVVSQREPIAFDDAWQVQTRSYTPALLEGQRLSFQLCANPVVTKKNASGKSQRHDVVMQAKKQLLAEQGLGSEAKWKEWQTEENKPLLYELVQNTCLAWLQARATKHGFEVVHASVDAYQQIKAKKPGERNIEFSTVDFSGELCVTDPQLFQHVLLNGLGHAKAFGCGLLLVKKAESE